MRCSSIKWRTAYKSSTSQQKFLKLSKNSLDSCYELSIDVLSVPRISVPSNVALSLYFFLNLILERKYLKLTVFTTSFKMAALSGFDEVMSLLLIWRNSPNCSMYSFSCSRRLFSLLHLLICDWGCKATKRKENLFSVRFSLFVFSLFFCY